MGKSCSFCGKEETPQLPILEGQEAMICKECAEICVEELKVAGLESVKTGLKPHQIKAELDKYVVGQDEAKKMLSVAAYNHYKRINSKSKVQIQKANILLMGPTGSGKTHIIQTLAKILDVPLVIGDATSLTQAGYVGDDVETLLEKLIVKANGDVRKAERGIVYLDEVDKIASYQSDSSSRMKDISGQGVQDGLLKLIEDSEVHLEIGNNPMGKQRVVINTKDILFIFGGAFVGLDKIIQDRSKGHSKTLGFVAHSAVTVNSEDKGVTQQDLVRFGFIPEFVGRIPVLTTLNPLSKQELMDILVKPKDAVVKQYKALLKMDGVKLTFHKSALEYIADEAMKKNVGARGLKGIVENRMFDIMYHIPLQDDLHDVTVTKEILSGDKPMTFLKTVQAAG